MPKAAPACDWTQAATWTFEPLDVGAFPAVDLAKDAAKQGSTFPAVFNAANEEAVTAFHAGRIRFTDIVPTVERVLTAHDVPSKERLDVDDVLAADTWARGEARRLLGLDSPDPKEW